MSAFVNIYMARVRRAVMNSLRDSFHIVSYNSLYTMLVDICPNGSIYITVYRNGFPFRQYTGLDLNKACRLITHYYDNPLSSFVI